jgi:hypothetical protein
LEGKNNPSGRFSSKTKMRGTGLGYALYSEIIKQARGTMYLEIGMSLIGIPIEFYENPEQKYLETGI